MIRRLAAVLLAALVAFNGLIGVECAGWLAAPSDRMDCCLKAKDGCANQLAADRCCATGEQSEHARIASGGDAVALLVALIPSVVTFAPPTAIFSSFRFSTARPQHPPHLQRTVLLI